MEEKLPSAGRLPSEFSTIVPALFSCLEDRSGDVRKKAQAALPHIMAHVGYDNMCKQCAKLGVSLTIRQFQIDSLFYYPSFKEITFYFVKPFTLSNLYPN